MKKSDLKAGYVIQYADNSFAMVMPIYNRFLNKTELKFIRQDSSGWVSSDAYNENFIQISPNSPSELAIKKIYGHPDDFQYTFICSNERRELLWAKEELVLVKEMTVEEIENILGYKIKIISNKH